jgi:hypothetical protein
MREVREMRCDEVKQNYRKEGWMKMGGAGKRRIGATKGIFFVFSAPSACCTWNACGRSSLPNRARLVVASQPITEIAAIPTL